MLSIKEIFDLQERHENMILNTSKNFFCDNYIMDIFVFISVIILLQSTTLTVYLMCRHKKIRALIASLVLYQAEQVGTASQETNSEVYNFGLHRNNSNNIRSNNSYILAL